MSIDYTNTIGRMVNPYWVDGTNELNEAIDEEMGVSQEAEDIVDKISINIEKYIKQNPKLIFKTIQFNIMLKFSNLLSKFLILSKAFCNWHFNTKYVI